MTAAVCIDETGLPDGEVERIPTLIDLSIANNWKPYKGWRPLGGKSWDC